MFIINGIQREFGKVFEKYTYLPYSQKNFAEAFGVTARRRMTALSHDHRPTSDPYISGDSFVKLSDHALTDEQMKFSPDLVQKGDLVFVNVHLLQYFFRVLHPQIRHPYVLLTHNGDRHIDAPYAGLIDQKIMHWYAQNVVIKHPKITPIPIGLENLMYHNHGELSLFEKNHRGDKKRNRILMDFSLSTNPYVRRPIYDQGLRSPLVDATSARLSASSYIQTLAKYTFVLSPPGNGLDCHRTWEAMLCYTVPIVQSSVAMESFKERGAPLWVVDDYEEVFSSTPLELEERYANIIKRAHRPLLYLQYWKDLIYA